MLARVVSGWLATVALIVMVGSAFIVVRVREPCGDDQLVAVCEGYRVTGTIVTVRLRVRMVAGQGARECEAILRACDCVTDIRTGRLPATVDQDGLSVTAVVDLLRITEGRTPGLALLCRDGPMYAEIPACWYGER